MLILKQLNKWEFVGQLKNVDGVNADGKQSMFILTILEKKNKRKKIKIFSRTLTVLSIMANYQEVKFKLRKYIIKKIKISIKKIKMEQHQDYKTTIKNCSITSF